MTRPCACAPGCRNIAEYEDRLCAPCRAAWEHTASAHRFYFRSETLEESNRHLADWARTRSRELENERSKP